MKAPPKNNQQPHAGFTLFEILIVVLLLGVIATQAFPMLKSGLENSRLSGAASEIAAALEYAQLIAMTTGQPSRVTIDDEMETILVEQFKINGDIFTGLSEIPEGNIDAGAFTSVSHPVKRGKIYYIVFASEERFSNIDITSASFGSSNYVRFNDSGVPSSGGTVTLTYGDKQAVIAIAPLTGKITSSN